MIEFLFKIFVNKSLIKIIQHSEIKDKYLPRASLFYVFLCLSIDVNNKLKYFISKNNDQQYIVYFNRHKKSPKSHKQKQVNIKQIHHRNWRGNCVINLYNMFGGINYD